MNPELLGHLREENPHALALCGLDDALVGVARRCGKQALLVYSFDKLVDQFVAEGMTPEDAVEHIEFNIAGAWAGPGTPLILYSE